MVCAATTPLHSLCQGSPHYGPRAKTRPAKPFHPAAKYILPIMKKYCIYKKCVDLECNISRKNHIAQDVWTSNCCVIAYVVLSQKIRRALVYMNWIDRQSQTRRRGCHCWELQDEPFVFCGRIGATCVDLLNRVFSTHLIGSLLRANKQERKSALKRLRYYVSQDTHGSVFCK